MYDGMNFQMYNSEMNFYYIYDGMNLQMVAF